MKQKIILRPYQEQALANIKKLYHEGKRNQLVVWPTGLGKTILFSSVTNWIVTDLNKKVLILAHRDELLDQATDKLSRFGDFEVEKEKAEFKSSRFANVVVASVQSIGRKDSPRIQKFDPNEFGAIVIDEAHHALGSTYQNVLNYFKQNSSILSLGLTATPKRHDGESLDSIYDSVAHRVSIIEATRKEYITPVIAHRIRSATSLDGIRTTAGDFNIKDLSHVVNNLDRNKLILDTYLKSYHGRQAIVFTVDVEHAQTLTDLFNSNGIKSEFICGESDKRDREKIIQDFHNGNLKVIFNFGILTEGFDNEALDLIISARPTQSELLLTQIIGRAFRLYPGKVKSDIVEICDEHNEKTATTAGIFDFKKTFTCDGHTFLECCNMADYLMSQKDFFPAYNTDGWTDMIKRFERATPSNPTGSSNPFELSKGQNGKEIMNLRETLIATKDNGEESRYSFFEIKPNVFRLAFRDKEEQMKFLIIIFKDELGRWVTRINRKRIMAKTTEKADTLFQDFSPTKTKAITFAEKAIKEYFKKFDNLLNRNAYWRLEGRKLVCSPAQYSQLKRLGLTNLPQDKVSKTMACDMLTLYYSK